MPSSLGCSVGHPAPGATGQSKTVLGERPGTAWRSQRTSWTLRQGCSGQMATKLQQAPAGGDGQNREDWVTPIAGLQTPNSGDHGASAPARRPSASVVAPHSALPKLHARPPSLLLLRRPHQPPSCRVRQLAGQRLLPMRGTVGLQPGTSWTILGWIHGPVACMSYEAASLEKRKRLTESRGRKGRQPRSAPPGKAGFPVLQRPGSRQAPVCQLTFTRRWPPGGRAQAGTYREVGPTGPPGQS